MREWIIDLRMSSPLTRREWVLGSASPRNPSRLIFLGSTRPAKQGNAMEEASGEVHWVLCRSPLYCLGVVQIVPLLPGPSLKSARGKVKSKGEKMKHGN